ncbi:GH25 family lysozyme [Streptomyces sp. NPDC055243]|uniref:GH25 family lysozyme n=1 Tax=Streptomyces sp. NPDC055243 TaxID=3365720 RepID=UPI0037D42CEE
MARDHKPSRHRARVIAASVATLALGGTALAEIPVSAAGKARGHDVSSHQKNVDWRKAKSKGARFVTSPCRASRRARSRATAYFMRHGGRWRADGMTLPPALAIEHNPYSRRKCYGMSRTGMVNWIKSFSDEVKRRTGRRPVIYTTTKWWNTCTGGSRAYGAHHPLWLARWSSTSGALPKGWSHLTIWQYDNGGRLPGDQNLFNGSPNQLKRFARG